VTFDVGKVLFLICLGLKRKWLYLANHCPSVVPVIDDYQ